jgi:hypothetical protein
LLSVPPEVLVLERVMIVEFVLTILMPILSALEVGKTFDKFKVDDCDAEDICHAELKLYCVIVKLSPNVKSFVPFSLNVNDLSVDGTDNDAVFNDVTSVPSNVPTPINQALFSEP